MKNVLFTPLIALALYGCQTTVKTTTNPATPGFASGLDAPTPVERQALDEALASIERLRPESRAETPDPTLQLFSSLKDYEWSAFDYYHMDIDKFMEDPRDERLEECFVRPTESFFFSGDNGKGGYVIAEVNKRDGRWSIEKLGPEAEKYLSWIEEVKTKTGSGDYRVLLIFFNRYYVFRENGKAVYYNPSGNAVPAEEVSGLIKAIHQNSEHARKNGTIILM